MIICSPWTRGGFVDSNSLRPHLDAPVPGDLDRGPQPANITAWRRSVTGDLTAAFDFKHPDFSIPKIPTLTRPGP